MTILFADISNSTARSERFDAEEAHELLYGATQKMCAAIEYHRDTVCRFMGDGIMAMFGAPLASEQHAVDACRAALEMQRTVGGYTSTLKGQSHSAVTIRVGVHSGEVVVLSVSEWDKAEYDASGPTVPIAARMEQCATPGRIYLTSTTHALACTRILARALDAVTANGISEPMRVFALDAVRTAEEALAADTRTRFVGRRGALSRFRGLLSACLEDGQGGTIYVRGEPGFG